MKYAFGITAGTSYFTAVDFGKLHGNLCILAGKQNGEVDVRYYRTLRPVLSIAETDNCQVRSCGFYKEGIWAYFRTSFIKFWQILPDMTSVLINQIPVSYSGFSAVFVFNSPSIGEEVVIMPEDGDDWAIVTVRCLQQQISYCMKTSTSLLLTKPAESSIFSLLPIEDHSTKFKSLHILVGNAFGSIQLWDVTREVIVAEARVHKEIVSELDFSALRSTGVSCSPADGVYIWRIDDEFCLRITHLISRQQPRISRVHIFPGDMDMFITADQVGTLTFLSLTCTEKKNVLNFHRKSVTCLRFAPREAGGWLLLVGSSDGVIVCWQMTDTCSSDSLVCERTAAYTST